MAQKVSPFWIAVGFLAAVSAGLFLYMWIVIGGALEGLIKTGTLDSRIMGYEAGDVRGFIGLLTDPHNADLAASAAALVRWMHLVPDMIFPVAFTALALLLLGRFAPGATVFHKPLSGYRLWIVFAVPFLYAASDYLENGLSLALFPPATPQPETLDRFSEILPLATRAKGMFFFITLIFMLRFSLFRDRPAKAADGIEP